MSIADQLIKRGWTKQQLLDPIDGSVCLRGAQLADLFEQGVSGVQEIKDEVDGKVIGWGGDGVTWDAHVPSTDALMSALKEQGWGYETIAAFNDAFKTEFDDVLRVAKRADEILEENRDRAYH